MVTILGIECLKEARIIVGQIKEIPQEVKPGPSETMEGAVAAACRRLRAEIGEVKG